MITPPQVFVRNSLTRKKEELRPCTAGQLNIYACGVTVYDECHIGHAMQAIFFDTIRRYLVSIGYKVNYVRNYTDVDDKIIARARERQMSPAALADQMIEACREDMAALGIKAADSEPRVRDFIPQIIEMIATLIQKGAAYATAAGDVYYRVQKNSSYGKLSGRRPSELLSGTRELAGQEKDDSLDFALWKADTTPEACWESPWGLGRPGWHIECSAMAKHCLNSSTIDIHGGGRDLIFPHHENEIAQSESANGVEFARVWMHSGLLTVDKTKMSKSLGNTISIKSFLQEFPKEVLRLSYLQNHYSSNIDFSRRVFLDARKRLFYYYGTLDTLGKLAAVGAKAPISAQAQKQVKAFSQAVDAAMCDDFNTPRVLAELATFTKWANTLVAAPKTSTDTFLAVAKAITSSCEALGLFQQDPETFLSAQKERVLLDLGIAEETIDTALRQRTQARQSQDWTTADAIREQLAQKGIAIRDTSDRSFWTVALDAGN